MNNKVDYLYQIGEMVGYVSPCGKLSNNRVESISISIGRSTYRSSVWVETAKTNIETNILYKLENVPAGYLLKEDSLIKINKEVEEDNNAE